MLGIGVGEFVECCIVDYDVDDVDWMIYFFNDGVNVIECL